MRAHSLYLSTSVSLAHELARIPAFSASCARAEKKCAASPGGTFRIVLQGLAIFNTRLSRCETDSLSPQVPILKEKLLVAVHGRLQTLAGDSLHIVAFG
jgi:hypothetical protein